MNQTHPIPQRSGTNPERPSTAAADHAPLLSPLRELQLVESYRAGDPEAIGTLLRSYQRRMYAVCYRMLRNEDEARDLTQESMVRVLEGIGSFDARARLSTWVIRVTMNCCLSHLRKRKLRRTLSIDAPFAEHPDQRSETVGPREIPSEGRELSGPGSVEQDEMRGIVLAALNRLDPHMRAVLVLRDMQELEYQQIAEVIEKPVGTVKSRLFRARAALREAVEALCGDRGDE